MHPRWPALGLLVAWFLSLSAFARADASPTTDDVIEDLISDGDLDEEDLALQSDPPVAAVEPRGHAQAHGGAPAHGASWVALVGFERGVMSGHDDLGAMLVVGLALDRLAATPTSRLADPATTTTPPAPAASPVAPPIVVSSLARQCVAAALRASGLSLDDARLEALVSRARASAWLPDMRLRAMRLMTDAAHATTLATTDGTSYYSAAGANLMLEVRLTWRLDRLVYAGEEPAVERARMERQEARSRLATRTLEALFAWQRAVVAVRESLAGSHEEVEARLRLSETQATLDVMTSGWFSRRESEQRKEATGQ